MTRGRVAAAALALAILTLADPAATGSAREGPFDDARRATGFLSFSGRVLVRWMDDDGLHGDALDVAASEGVVVVEGAEPLMARGGERLVRTERGDWDLLWPAALSQVPPPRPAPKYRVTRRVGPSVVGRLTVMAEVRRGRTLAERLYLDRITGLILRREQYDNLGRIRRSVTFDELTILTIKEPPPPPPAVSPEEPPAAASPARVAPPLRAPARLGDGYQRIGTYRRGRTLHMVYSDGLYGLSLFQEVGRLDAASLPAGGRAVDVAGAPGRRWSWPASEVVMWEAGGVVHTLVGDGLPGEVLGAARSLPAGTEEEVSLLAKLRRACRALLQGLA